MKLCNNSYYRVTSSFDFDFSSKFRCVNKRVYRFENSKFNYISYNFDSFSPQSLRSILDFDSKIGVKSSVYRLGRYLILETFI